MPEKSSDKPGRTSPVLGEGTYRMESRKLFLRTPADLRIEPAPEEPQAREEDHEEPAAAGPAEPSPQEIAQREAEAILEKARGEAEELKRREREEGRAQGRSEGIEEGRAQGREEAQAELREALDRWLTMGDALTEAWRARFEGLEKEVKDLSAAIAEKLVERQLEIAPEMILDTVREALRHAAEADLVTVLVSPRDVALVRQAREELAALLKGTGRFEIAEDQKIEPGGCVVETKSQVIDATRKARLGSIRDSIKPKLL